MWPTRTWGVVGADIGVDSMDIKLDDVDEGNCVATSVDRGDGVGVQGVGNSNVGVSVADVTSVDVCGGVVGADMGVGGTYMGEGGMYKDGVGMGGVIMCVSNMTV